jgi:ADP-ribosylglycohydrolase
MSLGRQYAAEHLRTLLLDEVQLKAEQGFLALSDFLARIRVADFSELHEIESELEALPEPQSLSTNEPLFWEIPKPADDWQPWTPIREELDDRIRGAWYGRIAGCILGKPVECHEFFARPKSLRAFLEATNQWPLRDYVQLCNSEMVRFAGHPCRFPPSTKGNIRYAQSDDDLRYTLAGLRIQAGRVDKSKPGVISYSWPTSKDVFKYWASHWLPNHTFTAEQAAISNSYAFGKPQGWLHEDASEDQLLAMRQWRNPYREWIGAAIRADGWAYSFAGDPYQAALVAQQDAKLTHERNGEYSEIFFAGWIAGAFRYSLEESFRRALDLIPTQSRLALVALQVREFCASKRTFDSLLDFIAEKTGHYNGVHSINNAAVCVGAVFLSEGDFELGITRAVMCGLDTDCNGATVGSILGANLGARALPLEKWIRPFNDTIDFEYVGEERQSIDRLAEWTSELWLELNRK